MFCGQKPNNKSKEHILPQWLLKLTGDPKRKVPLVTDFGGSKQFEFSFDQFTLPACSSCNQRYAILEGEVHPIIERLCEFKSATASEYDLVLDWLDKIRVGMWLALKQLNGQALEYFTPQFHIDTRIRQKDRAILIYPLNTIRPGLVIHGTNTLYFLDIPSCFSIEINNLFILNVSYDWLVSARAGFPFPKKVVFRGNAQYVIDDLDCFSRFKNPLVRGWNVFSPSIYLLQPIMHGDIHRRFLKENYLRQNTIPGEPRVGKILNQANENIKFLEHSETVDFKSIPTKHGVSLESLRALTFDMQTMIPHYSLSFDSYEQSVKIKEFWAQCRKQNQKCASFIKRQTSSSRTITGSLKNSS